VTIVSLLLPTLTNTIARIDSVFVCRYLNGLDLECAYESKVVQLQERNARNVAPLQAGMAQVCLNLLIFSSTIDVLTARTYSGVLNKRASNENVMFCRSLIFCGPNTQR
jgi:hypothetical protein